ncbi:PilX N-terminal domain-containing pilus assembly protein [Pseudomonas sp. NA-150]|uniref:pilus assembly PilX family protein n=1 Tax=Pseudomonas sp. NA-150 TaxID=3367525 RepID=UPI0037C75D6A
MTVRTSFEALALSRKQSGVTLIIAIIFLLLITLLGISSMRGVTLESRITGNLKEQKILTEAAEAGLRIGENSIGSGIAPTVIRTCTPAVCMPWQLSDLIASTTRIDTPATFTNATNVATVTNAYDPTVTKIQWYVVMLGKLGAPSVNSCASRGCGTWYYEVNACASTVLCTSDTTTPRIILRSVIARTYQ